MGGADDRGCRGDTDYSSCLCSLTSGDSGQFSLSRRSHTHVHTSCYRLALCPRPGSCESMAEPRSDPDAVPCDEKLSNENSKASSEQRDDEAKTSTEMPPSQLSHTSTTCSDSEDAGVASSRSLSEREDSEITSSVSSVMDKTPSLCTLNGMSASTDEPLTSVRSALDGEEEAGAEPREPSWSKDVMSIEAGQAAVSMPTSVPPSVPSSASPSVQEHYYVKWITWKGEKTPIITQSENGPCPLLAIMNILFLRWKVRCVCVCVYKITHS